MERVSNFQNDNYIELESNGDRNKTLSLEGYQEKIRPYLRGIKIDVPKSDTWRIQQLTIAIYFIFQKIPKKSMQHSLHVQRACKELQYKIYVL